MPLIHESVLSRPGVNQQHVGVTIHTELDRLPRSQRDDLDFGIVCRLEVR